MSHYPHFHRRESDPEGAHFERLPPGMTAEQLEFFTEQTERAVNIGVRKGVREYRNQALVGFALLLVGVGVATGLTVQNGDRDRRESTDSRKALVASGRVVSVDGCNRDYSDREKFRELLERLRDTATVAFKAGRTTPEQYQQALDFYDEQLDRYPSIDCRRAEEVITDDPSSLPSKPQPCWKGNPNNPEECKALPAKQRKG